MYIPFGNVSGSVTVDLLLLCVGTAGLAICSCVATCIYNAYLHPLSGFPGPKLWSTSFVFRHWATIKGELDWDLVRLHEIYGPVVRFSPEEVSFIGEQAWKDIYGNRSPPLLKDAMIYNIDSRKTSSIFNADEQTHPRMRKQLAHAFSAKALREQEPQVRRYVDVLISRLETATRADGKMNMDDWYNFTTFDLVGDLAIGKSFDTLQNPDHQSWTKDIWASIKVGTYYRAVATYINPRRLLRIIESCLPDHLTDGRDDSYEFMDTYAEERIAKGVMEERKDFLSYILKHQDKANGLTEDEIEANCRFLVVAGSETTATALSGMTYNLLRNPDKLAKLTAEIRGAFDSEDEMTFTNLASRLPYTFAVIQESMRLYPSAPTSAPRRTPPGRVTMIDGYEVPGGMSVGVHALTASRSSMNFHEPLKFVPERWLPDTMSDPTSPYYHDRRSASQPFSFGPRACLGKSLAYDELRSIIARVFWKFDLELCEESKDWGERQLTFGLWAKPPLMCKLRDTRKKWEV